MARSLPGFDNALRIDGVTDNLYLIGPRNDGAEQLRVNGYTFTGYPPAALSSAVLNHFDEILLAASFFDLPSPTIYFAEHAAFPKRLAAFIGESGDDPMIVLFPEKIIKEPGATNLIKFPRCVVGYIIHELAHAYVENYCGNAFAIEERFVMEFERQYVDANSRSERLAALSGFRKFCQSILF